MGTNYHHRPRPCDSCGRTDPGRHIGKSSAGWCFALHVYPEDGGPTSLAEWEELLRSTPDYEVVDEYGNEVSVDAFLARVRDRKNSGRHASAAEAAAMDADPGPRGLLRIRVGDRCVAHGEGTWDLVVGLEDYW